MAHILIVEDEEHIAQMIGATLALGGYTSETCADGQKAVERIFSGGFELILLDVMLPGLDGFAVYQQAQHIPTIFLTAKSGLPDRVRGLTMGADDYISKPFEMLELLARVEAVLRRTMKSRASFELDQMKIDFDSRQIFLRGCPVDCTPKEYALLETLVNNRNIALSRERLLELVWGYDFEGDTRTVDVHIQKLRKKLELEDRIKTVYKLGYRLEASP